MIGSREEEEEEEKIEVDLSARMHNVSYIKPQSLCIERIQLLPRCMHAQGFDIPLLTCSLRIRLLASSRALLFLSLPPCLSFRAHGCWMYARFFFFFFSTLSLPLFLFSSSLHVTHTRDVL